ncbi:MAG: hypothetical protein GX974_00085 [Clostridiales bacterium]|nr:hypothetical protein [Clostridiales bacterium]
MSMKREVKLFDAITGIRDDLIEQAQDAMPKTNRIKRQKWSAIAACVILVVGIGGIMLWQNILPFGGSDGNAGSSGNGHEKGSTVFMSYAGPVFPLTLLEKDSQVTAERNITYDFSLANEDSLRVWGAEVQDNYILTNHSKEARKVNILYSFASSFSELQNEQPTITVDGKTVQPTLYPGGYSGEFTGIYGENNPDGSENYKHLDSWEGYKNLLADGSYQENAFSPYPELDQRVIVYEFSDYKAPLEEYQAATEAISFTIDPTKTTILEYGFEGMSWDEKGYREYSYFIPDGITMHAKTHLLIVLGDDIGDYSLQGYKSGSTEPGNELDTVSSTVTRYEGVLSDIVNRLIDDYFSQYDGGIGLPKEISKELYFGATGKFLYEHGTFARKPANRYQDGRLMDIISEVNVLKQIFYLEVPVIIPADGQITVNANLHKRPSFDFACTDSKNVGVQGYDMVTQLGSSLYFKSVTAEVTNTKNIEIIRQNFGFDPSAGITKVTLDPAIEHYYLEIKAVEQ